MGARRAVLPQRFIRRAIFKCSMRGGMLPRAARFARGMSTSTPQGERAVETAPQGGASCHQTRLRGHAIGTAQAGLVAWEGLQARMYSPARSKRTPISLPRSQARHVRRSRPRWRARRWPPSWRRAPGRRRLRPPPAWRTASSLDRAEISPYASTRQRAPDPSRSP
jgi:hypothetical protein